MRAVVQRVSEASVCLGDVSAIDAGARATDETCSEIETGLMVLLGVADGDGQADVDYIADKLANLRIFPDDAGKMNRSVEDVGGSVLLVSQFTLLGDVRRGRRPDFFTAAAPAVAEALYLDVASALATRGIEVKQGVFGAHMRVSLVNEGPVTILLDSKKLF